MSSPRAAQPRRPRLVSRAPVAVLAAACALAVPAGARAEQFVLFQQTFEITKATVDRAASHYFVRGKDLNQPPGNDWTKPVDYRNGTVHIRTEVLEKPAGGEPNHWSYCYMPNRPIGPGYGCAGSGRYTEKGVYDRVEKMTSWWQNTAISWPQGIKEMHLVIKGMGDSGHLHKRSDVDKLYPSKVRITMVQVSAGGTFDPSKVPGMENTPAPDAGAPIADAGAAEAAAPPDEPPAPGPSGSGGASGTVGGSGGSGSAIGGSGGAQGSVPAPAPSASGGSSGSQPATGAGTPPAAGNAGGTGVAQPGIVEGGGCTLASGAGGSSARNTGAALLAITIVVMALVMRRARRRR